MAWRTFLGMTDPLNRMRNDDSFRLEYRSGNLTKDERYRSNGDWSSRRVHFAGWRSRLLLLMLVFVYAHAPADTATEVDASWRREVTRIGEAANPGPASVATAAPTQGDAARHGIEED